MILLDTHVVAWVLLEPDRLSQAAHRLVADAEGLAVADITWYELAWLLDAGRIAVVDAQDWLRQASQRVETLPVTWSIAHRAAGMSRHRSFPQDPADRLVYTTAVEHELTLLTKDRALRRFDADVCRW